MTPHPGDLVRIGPTHRFPENWGEIGVIVNVDVEGDGAAFYFVLLKSGTWWFVRTELTLVNDGTDGYDREKENRMTLKDLEKLLSEKTNRKVEFGPTYYDTTTQRFNKGLLADGRKIEFKWQPIDDEKFEETETDMETALIETVCWVINATFEKENP